MPRSGSNPPSERRRAAERAGRTGEVWAGLYLRLRGYRVLATRFKTPVGEIDIIARRGSAIVFVEVKRRSRIDGPVSALEAVNPARITRAAGWFQARHPQYRGFDFRFDVIVLAPGRWPAHLENAFPAD